MATYPDIPSARYRDGRSAEDDGWNRYADSTPAQREAALPDIVSASNAGGDGGWARSWLNALYWARQWAQR